MFCCRLLTFFQNYFFFKNYFRIFFRMSKRFSLGLFHMCDKYPKSHELAHLFSIILIDFWLTVKAATLIIISGCCSASSSAKQEKSGSIYNLVKN